MKHSAILGLGLSLAATAPAALQEEVHPSLRRIEPGVAPEADHPVDLRISLDGATALLLHRTTGNLSFYDMLERRVAGVLEVGDRPREIELTPDGRLALIVNEGSRSLSVISLSDRELLGEVALGSEPVVVRSSPDSRTAWVSDFTDQTVSRVDLKGLAVTATSPAPVTHFVSYGTMGGTYRTFSGFEVTPDGTALLWPSFDAGRLEVRDGATLQVEHSIVAAKPRSVRPSSEPGQATLVYGNGNNHRVGTLDWIAGALLSSKKLPQADISDGRYHAVTPAGTAVLDVNNRPARLSLTMGNFAQTNERANALALTADGRWLVAAEDQIRIYEPETLELVAALPAGSPNEHVALLALSPLGDEGVAIVRFGVEELVHFTVAGAASEVLEHVSTGPNTEGDGPGGLVLSADGSTAWVANMLSDNISEIDLAHGEARRHIDVDDAELLLFPGRMYLLDEETKLLLIGATSLAHFFRIIDLESGLALTDVDFGLGNPTGASFTPDQSRALVALPKYDPWAPSDDIAVVDFDGAQPVLVDRISVGTIDIYDALPAVSTDGTAGLVTRQASRTAQVLDLERGVRAGELSVPGVPRAVALQPGGSQGAVGHTHGVTFLFVDSFDSRVVSTQFVGDVTGLVYDSAGERLYASVQGPRGGLVVLDAATREVLQQVELQDSLARVELNADENALFALEAGSPQQAVFWFTLVDGLVVDTNRTLVGGRIQAWSASAQRDRMVVTVPEHDRVEAFYRPYVQEYGRATGSSDALVLRAEGKPAPGGTVQLTLEGAPPETAGRLIAGFEAAELDLGEAATLLVAPPVRTLMEFKTDSEGHFSVPLTVPSGASWNGVTVYVQAGVVPPEGLALSPGLELGIWE